MPNSPTIVSAALSDKELQDSINKMVANFDKGLRTMLEHSNEYVGKIQASLQKIGDTNFGAKGSNDGGVAKSTKAQNAETVAVKESTQAHKEKTLTLDQEQAVIQKTIDAQNKLFYARTMKIPTDQYDMQIAKLERIQSMLDRYRRGEASFTPSQVSGLEKEERTLLQLLGQVNTAQQQVTSSTQQTAIQIERENKTLQEQKEHLALIRDIAREARRDISLFGRANITNYKGTVYAENDARAKGLTIEQQIEKIIAEENAARNARVKIERQITEEVEKQGKKYVAPSSYSTPMTSSLLRGFVGDKLGLTADKLVTSDASSPIKTVNAEMKQLQEIYQKMTDAERTSPFGTQLRQRFQELQRQSQQLNAQLSRPVSLKDALKGSEKTLDDLAAKIRRLQSYMQGLDTSTEKSAQEFQRAAMHVALLKEKQNELLNKNSQLIRSNNELFKSNTALGRSWNYMKNRLAFYFTVGASTQFVKNLIEVRSQYEMNERALGILVNSAERGSQIFNELSQMALVSPYTLIELSAAAKQLTAYDVAAKDVVDTTRRLADMASAVGIPIERLTYALGQIKAYGYLNSRDARMFANAGIPLVKQLSDYYTELEGKLVSTADIYDRIKKKAIGYNDVMQVVNKMTDEGGKFFDFQAKMADTLKVQLANLTLAWNNLLNDIGEQTQGVLTFGIGALKSLFLAWKDVSNVLGSVAIAFGGYKAMQMLANVVIGKATRQTLKYVEANKLATWQEYHRALSIRGLTKDQARWLLLTNQSNKALVAAVMRMGVLDAATVRYIASLNGLKKGFAMLLLGGKMAIIGLGKALKSLGLALAANLPLLAIMGAISIWQNLSENAEKIKKINEDIVNNAKESSKNIGEFLQRNIDLYKSLYEWGGESGKEIVGKKDIGRAEAAKAWDAIREEIETSSQASKIFVRELLDIGDINERVRKGFDYAKQIQAATSATQELGEEAVKVTSDVAWGIFGEGLKSDLQDYLKGLNGESIFGDSGAFSDVFKEREREFLGELHETTNSIAAEIERLNLTPLGAQEAFARMADAIIQSEGMTAAQSEVFRIALEKDFTDVQRKMLEVKKLAALSPEERAAIQERIDAFDKAFGGTNKAALEAFFTWVRNGYTHLFDGMTEEDLKNINLQDERYAELWRNYEKNFKRSHYAAYKELGDSVKEISTWSINIPVFFNVLDSSSESVLDKWTKADKDLKDAKEKVDRLSRGIRQLKEGTKEYTAAQEELNSARKDEADARSRGGLDKEKKGGGSKKDVVLESLKQEIDLVKKLQGEYDKLTQKGATHADAMSAVQSAYGKTLSLINQRLRKMGLSELNLSIVTGKDPNMQLEHFKKTLEEMERKGLLTTERSKAVEAVIQELTVSAKTYNLDKLTKGLNSELDKLKDEYELAVELDANPELGSIFADYMGIDLNELPKNAEEAAKKAQQYIDKILRENKSKEKIDIASLMGKDAFDKWIKSSGHSMEDDLVKVVDNYRQALHKMQVDESKKQMQEWEKLLEKYAEYEYKVTQIQKEAERERETARKKGASQEILDAIDERERQELAKLSFEEFQKSPEWIVATGDLANMSKSAIGMLIEQLEKYKRSAKNLSPKQIKQLNSALSKLYKGQRKNNPFKAISNMLDEAKERMATFDEDIEKTQKEIDNLTKKKKENIVKGIADEETDNKLKKAIKRLKELKEAREKTGKVDASSWVSSINETIDAVQSAIGVFNDLAKAIGGVDSSDLDKVFSVVDKAGQGAAIGAQIGGGYGAIIGAVAGAATGLISIFAGAANERITAKVEESERAVKRLENTYKNLSHTAEEAYGAMVSGAKKAMQSNKELQLIELKRQLALEKSRDSKHRDEDKIADLEGQIIDLKNEIHDATQDIINDLLDISSAGDGIESLVGVMIDAFRNGEDAMEAFGKEWDKMIDNMILKLIVTQFMKQAWDTVMDNLKKKQEEFLNNPSQAVADAQKKVDRLSKMSDAEIAFEIAQKNGTFDLGGWMPKGKEGVGVTNNMIENYKKAAQDALTTATEVLNGQSLDYTKWSLDYMNHEGRDYMTQYAEMLKNSLGDWYTYGENNTKELSALQQGLQSMSESTAESLEAYMNGVSQQVYLHSELLTQIRDAVIGFDSAAQLGALSGILLQLQATYQVQMTIQNTLNGWSNPSGQAVRVEIL